MFRTVFLLIFMCVSLHLWGWNHNGHREVARIAWQNMTPQTRQAVMGYLKAARQENQRYSFVYVAPWLDGIEQYRSLHYIDIPFSQDGTRLMPPQKNNIVSAMEHAVKILKNPQGNPSEKGLELKILIHLMSDVHQPMHAVSQFSRRHPEGDKGGNLFYLGKNPVGGNLHTYWDRGGGLLLKSEKSRKSTLCTAEPIIFSPMEWAKESHDLAVHEAYKIKSGQKLTKKYKRRVQRITQKRINQAGCRLAALLNAIVF